MRLVGQNIKLRKEHMMLMRLPPRFWKASLEGILSPELKKVTSIFIDGVHEHLDDGVGFLFYGNNGIGKTGAACVIAKAVRRTGASVFYTTAESLRQAVLRNEVFSEFQSTDDRAHTAELLVLDDLGKEHSGSTGWSETYWENLIRVRNASKRSTIVTTNLDLDALQNSYYPSMLESMKECMLPVFAEGKNRRDDKAKALAKKFAI
jgi:DNA replication protein DnaC